MSAPRWAARTVAVVLTLAATQVEAGPTVWRRAADPQLHQRAQTTETVDDLLSEHAYLRRQPTSFRRNQLLQQAHALLEQAGAASAADPALHDQLGQVLELLWEVESAREHLTHAAQQYEAVASSSAPDSTRADALGNAANCYARLGDHQAEVDANDRALLLERDPEKRAIVLANQAEGRMALGQTIEAVRGYRAALAILPSALMPGPGVTTLWGLAVALDRSGDLDGALAAVAEARSYDPLDRRLHDDSWFYVPEYDVYWYEALGHWQRARASDGELALDAYASAIASWRAYLDHAAPEDPWVAHASQHLTRCERERHQSDERRKRRRSAAPGR